MTERNPTDAPEKSVEDIEKRRKSSGEQFFDWTVYGAMNYVGTFLLTLKLAYEIKHGGLKKAYDGMARGLKNAKVPSGIAEAGLATFITFWGGNVMLLPVKLAETFKVGIASTLNKWMGDDTDPSQIKEAPKQTWLTLIQGRFVAFGVVLTSMLGAEFLFKKQFEGFQKNVGEYFQRKFTHRWSPQKAYHYGEMAALDVFATAASTILLYITSHTLAQKREEKIERQHELGQDHPGHVHRDGEMEEVAPAQITQPSADRPRPVIEAATHQHASTLVQPSAELQAGA